MSTFRLLTQQHQESVIVCHLHQQKAVRNAHNILSFLNLGNRQNRFGTTASVRGQSMDGYYLPRLQQAKGPTDCKALRGDFQEREVNKKKIMINSSTPRRLSSAKLLWTGLAGCPAVSESNIKG